MRAESALEYAAAISPKRNKTPIKTGVFESIAIAEKSMSGLSKGIEFDDAYIYNSAPRNKKIRLTMIGPDKNKWDEVGVVWYPNMKKFLEMTEIDWYKSSFIHREAALNDTRLITCYDMSLSMKVKLRIASWFGKILFK